VFTLKELPSPAPGTLVDVRGARWRIVETIEHQDCSSCRLAGASASNTGSRRTLLLPFDRPRPVVCRTRLRRVGRRRWLAGFRALLAATCRADSLRGAAEAGIDLLEYQLEPAIACARGATRILLADEVGLGKTIQAGLILADLRARDESVRALILCPAGLSAQWLHELRDRFGLAADLLDRAAVRRLRVSSAGAGPWEQVPIAVTSVDFVKRPEVLAGMEPVRWDLLVVDEAHLSALAPERASAVNSLAKRSRRVVLMTATPHPGEPGAFEALCRIGRLPGEGPALMFRRTRGDVGLPVERHCRILTVMLTPAERRLHRLLERYTSRVWDATAAGPPAADARLAMVVLRKRAASGTRSLLTSLTRRLRGLAGSNESASEQMALPFEDEDGHEASDDEPGMVLSAPGLMDAESERLILERLVGLAAAAAGHDSKTRVLIRLIRRVREPVIVFTEYRDTLAHLAEVCGGHADVAMIHGGMDRRERAEAVCAFNRGAAGLLLATDAAAHGLNLQSRCRLVVSLELPWNPVRLEQRIGRVDRIGQKRAVHAVHLVARHTGEERVLARLATRVARASQALGAAEGPLGPRTEADIAEAAFARRARNLSPAPPVARRSSPADPPPRAVGGDELVVRPRLVSAARHEARRLRQVRALTSRPWGGADRGAAVARVGPWWTTLRLRGPRLAETAAGVGLSRGSLIALFETDLVDGRGLLLDRSLSVLVGPIPARWPARGGAVAALIGPGTSARAALDREAERCADTRLSELRVVLAPRLAGARRRELAIAEAVDQVPIVACQPGLFDRRAWRQASDDREARLERKAEHETQLGAIARAAAVSLAAPPRLVLAAVIVT
jgi:superfamily II DNA or RNA helicase